MLAAEGERLLAGHESKSPDISRVNEAVVPKPPSPIRRLVLVMLVGALVVSGVANSVIQKVVRCWATPLIGCVFVPGVADGVTTSPQVSDSYGQQLAFFVDQANNVLYLVLAIGVVAFKLLFTKGARAGRLGGNGTGADSCMLQTSPLSNCGFRSTSLRSWLAWMPLEPS